MKFVSSKNSKGMPLGDDDIGISGNSSDLIRQASVKSSDSARMRGDGMRTGATNVSGGRRHSWFNTLALCSIFAIAAVALGLGAAALASTNSNSDSLEAVRADLRALAGNRPSTAAASSSTSTTANGAPEVLLRSTATPPDGYSFQGSLYRGAGYWANRPSVALDKARANHQAVTDGSIVYIVGGRTTCANGTTASSDALIRFDAVLGLYGNAAKMPQTRFGHASVLLNNKIYVIGGYSNGNNEKLGVPATTVLVYDTKQGKWSNITSDTLSKPRAEACAAAVNGKIYVVGGFKANHTPTDTIEQFDPASGNWTEVGKTSDALGNVGCAGLGGMLYIAGGTPTWQGVNRSNSVSTVVGFNVTSKAFVPLASMSVARSNLQLVASSDGDGSLYAIGGQKLAKSGQETYYVGEPSVEAYLPKQDVWIRKAPLDNPRFSAAAVSTVTGVFVFGGNLVCGITSGTCRTLTSVESLQVSKVPDAFVHVLNPSANPSGTPAADVLLTSQHNGSIMGANGKQWRVAGSLYQGQGYWAMHDDMPMGHLSDFQIVPVFNDANQRVGALLTGGLDDNKVSNQTWMFDAVLMQWTRRADMPVPRTRHAAALAGGKLYVMGGFESVDASDEGVPATTMLVFDTKNNSWSTSSAKPTVPRTDGCAAAVLGKVYYAGGYGAGYNATLDVVEVFDPDTNTFRKVTAMPTPRGDVMCASLQDTLVVLGGYWDPTDNWTPNSFRKEVEQYNPVTKDWESLAPMPVARGDMAIAELPNNRLMVLGGETTDDLKTRTMVASNQVHEYIASQDVWVPKAPMIESRFRFDAAFVNGAVYVFGGDQSSASGQMGSAPNGLKTVESYQYTQVPDVFVWTSQ